MPELANALHRYGERLALASLPTTRATPLSPRDTLGDHHFHASLAFVAVCARVVIIRTLRAMLSSVSDLRAIDLASIVLKDNRRSRARPRNRYTSSRYPALVDCLSHAAVASSQQPSSGANASIACLQRTPDYRFSPGLARHCPEEQWRRRRIFR